jgi:transketolase
MELFFAAAAGHRDAVAPANITNRVAVEAAASFGWHRFVGLTGRVVAIDRFGESAPGPVAMEHLGITAEAVAQAARDQR